MRMGGGDKHGQAASVVLVRRPVTPLRQQRSGSGAIGLRQPGRDPAFPLGRHLGSLRLSLFRGRPLTGLLLVVRVSTAVRHGPVLREGWMNPLSNGYLKDVDVKYAVGILPSNAVSHFDGVAGLG